MIFLNPKSDFAFKKIFGSEQSHDILISFLNGILYDGESTIASVQILNPYQPPKVRGMKDTFLDIKAKLDDGTTVIIEMQVLNVEGFEKRVLYNAAKGYSTQLSIGEDSMQLDPVIALTITDFEMFPGLNTVVSRFVLKEKTFLIDYPIDDIELVFVELPKFHSPIEEIHSLKEQWIYFLQNARTLNNIPSQLSETPALQHAFTVASQANLTREELEEFEGRERVIHDRRNSILYEKNKGLKALEEARQEGLKALEDLRQQGLKDLEDLRQQGLKAAEEGLEQGDRTAREQIARQLLALMSDEQIALTTGLSIEMVQHLRAET